MTGEREEKGKREAGEHVGRNRRWGHCRGEMREKRRARIKSGQWMTWLRILNAAVNL